MYDYLNDGEFNELETADLGNGFSIESRFRVIVNLFGTLCFNFDNSKLGTIFPLSVISPFSYKSFFVVFLRKKCLRFLSYKLLYSSYFVPGTFYFIPSRINGCELTFLYLKLYLFLSFVVKSVSILSNFLGIRAFLNLFLDPF